MNTFTRQCTPVTVTTARLLALASGAALAALTALAQDAPTPTTDRLPNIVIIFTDDQGYGDVGVFGAKGFTTPHLDSLARDGVKFTNFHVAQAVCSASRAALLTGCYPNRIGIHGALGPSATHGLHADETTLAELLKARGYATGMAGKWHLGHHEEFLPGRHGFDESFGLPYSNDMWPQHPEANPGSYPNLPLIENGRIIDDEVTADDQRLLTTRYTEKAVSFIERHRDQPFFFYLAHSMPHVPLFVHDERAGKSSQGLYGDVIMEIDWSVGEVLAALARHGLDQNTLVIFTSDNGPWLSYGDHAGSAGPLREGKGTSWEGGVRVPCLMRWPGHLPAGTVNDRFLMAIDLLPTVAARVAARLPDHPIDGRDVWPLITAQPDAASPHDGYAFWFANNELQAVVSGDGKWKLALPHRYRTLAGRPGGTGGRPVRYQTVELTAPALYDLQSDMEESTDRAADHPDVVARLLAFAEARRVELGDSLHDRPHGTGTRPAGTVQPAQ